MKNRNKAEVFFIKKSAVPVDVKSTVLMVLDNEKVKNAEVNIIFTDNKFIKKINLEYRKKNYPTDVIVFSFSGRGKNCSGGDIFISPERVKSNAKKYGVAYKEELARVIIHGVLHVLGYDHEKSKPAARKMAAKQESYLKTNSKKIKHGVKGG